MKNTFRLYFSIILFILCLKAGAQVPTGQWRDHLPYSHGERLAEYNNRMYCLTSDGSLFSYSLADGSLTRHTKINGLSDADITVIGASAETKTLLIGYKNGNIDLVRNDSIINLPDIVRESIMGGKSIRNVYLLNRFAYLACDFGIVLCDLIKKEIKETYFFGPGGTQISVNDITSDDTYIYAATDQGIFRARLDHPNLLDFNAWSAITGLPDPTLSYSYIVSFGSKLYTIYRTQGSDDLISFDGSGWQSSSSNFAARYEFIGSQKGMLIISSSDKTRLISQDGTVERDVVSYIARHVLIDEKDNLWYAAMFGGLVRIDREGNGSVFAPSGPPYRDVNDIESLEGNVWVAGGTFNSKWLGYGAYSLVKEEWKEYNGNSFPELKDFLNIAEIAIDPSDPAHVVGGSNGYGIAEFQDGKLVDIENETGDVLKPVQGKEAEAGYVRITGVAIDPEGTIYAVGSNSPTAAYRKPKEGQWEALDLEYEEFNFNVNTGKIMISSGDQKWLAINNRGIIIVFQDENGTVVREQEIEVKNQFGDAASFILSLAEDKDGLIWVGTNKGPFYYDAADIFDSGKPVGHQPVVPRNDGTNSASLLLSSEQINDIAVDGANRKWIATEKSGVYLLSENGMKELHHFTAENSPLLSNSVQTIGINDKTGEVFFGTEKGIIAYRGGATEGGDDFGDVYVFPNPVRETYNGNITVTGLAANVNVKFTDIAGNLVYETTALGGQAVWNGRNFRGDRVQTGVYLVFCTNDDGSKTFVTKLLFIH